MRRRDIIRAGSAAALLATTSLAATQPAAAQIGESGREYDAEQRACGEWRTASEGIETKVRVCGQYVEADPRQSRPTPYARVGVQRWQCDDLSSRECAAPQQQLIQDVSLDAVQIAEDGSAASIDAVLDGCAVNVDFVATSAARETRDEDYTQLVDYEKNQVQVNKRGTYIIQHRYATAQGDACGWAEVGAPSTTAYIERVRYSETWTYVDIRPKTP